MTAYFGHYYVRDPIADSLKLLAGGSEMVVRKLIPEDTAMFRLAKRTYYAYAGRHRS